MFLDESMYEITETFGPFNWFIQIYSKILFLLNYIFTECLLFLYLTTDLTDKTLSAKYY